MIKIASPTFGRQIPTNTARTNIAKQMLVWWNNGTVNRRAIRMPRTRTLSGAGAPWVRGFKQGLAIG